jgi:hypothetical protein
MSSLPLDDAIRYLVQSPEILPGWAATIDKECRAHPPLRFTGCLFAGEHTSPPVRVQAGGASQAGNVFRFLLRNGKYSAPALTNGPIYTAKSNLYCPAKTRT